MPPLGPLWDGQSQVPGPRLLIATYQPIPADTTVPPPPPVVVEPVVRRGGSFNAGVPGYTIFDPSQGADVLPPPTVVVDRPERRLRAPDPVTISGAQAVSPPPSVTPPPPTSLDRVDRRAKPTDPIVISGALAVPPPTVVTPPAPVVVIPAPPPRPTPLPQIKSGFDVVVPPQPDAVDRPEQRQRFHTPDPIVLSGSAALVAPPGANPPPIVVVPLFDERGRRLPQLPPEATSGFVDPGPGPVGTTPPPTVNIDRVDRRPRPPEPIALSGAQAATPPPAVTPPAPFVVPLEERRRLLAQLPPTVKVGYDDVQPPEPNVVDPNDGKRRRGPTPDATVLGGASSFTPPTVVPTGPYVVPLTERSKLFAALGLPVVQHGPVPPPTVTPPAPFNLDRVDQRVRYEPLKPLVLSGVLATAPAIPITTTFFGPPNPGEANLIGQPDNSGLQGSPDNTGLRGQPDNDAFAPPNPGRS